ncbi:hypothetical protein ECG_07559 [Echinococcus granulosus]|nr:hypothetical protein ECG_07559 [Echinococcus granulosus]
MLSNGIFIINFPTYLLLLPIRVKAKECFARQRPQPRSNNAADNLFVDTAAFTAAGEKAYEQKEVHEDDQNLIGKYVDEAVKRNKQAKMHFCLSKIPIHCAILSFLPFPISFSSM